MPIIRTEITIAAPPERCFDFARDMNVHVKSARSTRERVIEAPTGGKLELGDVVELEAVHFGIRQRLRSKIVEYRAPDFFVDEMQRGAFARLRHRHEFQAVPEGTRMVDTLDFASPFGWLGAIVDALVVAPYMKRFMHRRNLALKQIIEVSR
jgi:ligand-binding SRPBCC domain-containing protein